MQDLIHYYYQQIKDQRLISDPYQLEIINYLQKLSDDLLQEKKKKAKIRNYFRSKKIIKGLYLWGSVGAGKTFLMDCFFNWLPIKEKMRIHFNAFMRLVHESLKVNQGKKNPLQYVAKGLAEKYSIICFDELNVTEIVDAVLLAELFKSLINHKIKIIFTSNKTPDDLYKRGLLREKFLPTIALIKAHTEIMHLDNHTDYRLRHLKEAGVFFLTTDSHHHQKMEKLFDELNADQPVFYHSLTINNRKINIVKYTDDIAWFEFDVLCHIPRSDKDYLAIADIFKTLFISNIPVIKPEDSNTAILFIRLIDILYDSHTRLIFSAAATPNNIYPEGSLYNVFQRTCSRLIEMQSNNYFLIG